MARIDAFPSDNYYQYNETGVIKCGDCLNIDIAKTKSGEYVDEERVYMGMFLRLRDDKVEAYQCDECLKQNAAYEQVGVDPETGDEIT